MCEHEKVNTPEPPPVLDESSETCCYGHKDIPTRLRCSRCERPICGRCAIPASVGQHCPECVAEARRGAPKVRTALQATAPGVRAIIGITILFFIADRLLGLTNELASYPPATAAGQWYRLFTPMLLHANLLHIGLNMYILYIYGPHAEQAFGTVRFVAIYAISGFLGAVASYAFSPCQALGVGASGAVFGIAGVLFAYAYNRRASALMGSFLGGLRFFIIANLVLGFIIPGIDNFAHLGGLASGLLLGFGFDRPASPTRTPVQLATATSVIALGVALVVYRTATFTCDF